MTVMAIAYQVLLVEDDPIIAKTLKMSLFYKGFEVTTSKLFSEGLELFRCGEFDVVLLDIQLPDGNGLDLCREIRKSNSTVPILMLTARTDEDSAVRGLEQGADDFIRKPYGVLELTARMNRFLEKKKKANIYHFGTLKIDGGRQLAWANGICLRLGKREFEILTVLVRKSGDTITRNELLDSLSLEADLYDRTIDSHLSHLRRKLKNAGALDVVILPVYGVGYRLEKRLDTYIKPGNSLQIIK